MDKKINFNPNRICLIGDGYGVRGLLLKKFYPNSTVTFIDLGLILTFCSIFVRANSNNCRFNLVVNAQEKPNPNDAQVDFHFIASEDIDWVKIDTKFD